MSPSERAAARMKYTGPEVRRLLLAALDALDAADARERDLKAQLATARGFDRQGDGKKPARGYACHCRWASAVYGDTCPEHGVTGIPIESAEARIAAMEAENARLRADLQHAAVRLADCSEVLGRRAERDGSR